MSIMSLHRLFRAAPRLRQLNPISDMQRLLACEGACALPWDEARLLAALDSERRAAWVAEVGRFHPRLAGYMLFQIGDSGTARLLRLVVHPEHRRQWIGSFLGASLIQQLSRKDLGGPLWERILADVPETCLDAQLLLRKLKFRALRVLRREGDDGGDLFRFCYRLHAGAIRNHQRKEGP